MSKVTIDEEKCPKDKQYCFKQDYGKGKKPMTENCYNEKYVPIKMLDLLLSDSKDDRQLTNCQNLCTCKQFDDAWFMVINDILARIGSLINILTKMNDKEKKTMVAESLKKSKSNSSPLQIAPILEKVIDIGSKRWDLPPNSNSNKKWDNTTNVGSFLAILEEVKNSKLIQLFDINLKNGEKINSEIMDKIHNLNNLNFNEVISHFKKIKALFELIKHLGNKKENLESTIKNELEEHVKDIIDYKPPSKGGSRKKIKKFKKNKKSNRRNKKGGQACMGICIGIAVFCVLLNRALGGPEILPFIFAALM